MRTYMYTCVSIYLQAYNESISDEATPKAINTKKTHQMQEEAIQVSESDH